MNHSGDQKLDELFSNVTDSPTVQAGLLAMFETQGPTTHELNNFLGLVSNASEKDVKEVVTHMVAIGATGPGVLAPLARSVTV